MLNEVWKHFKSGTDIRGVATEGAGFEVDLTDKNVTAMVDAFILWLCAKTGKTADELKVSVGRDSRISGQHLLDLACASMVRSGITVLDCDLASTPSMFMTTVDMLCDGALMLTASHHPYYRNGLKFFTREGGLEGKDIEDILSDKNVLGKNSVGTMSEIYIYDLAIKNADFPRRGKNKLQRMV